MSVPQEQVGGGYAAEASAVPAIVNPAIETRRQFGAALEQSAAQWAPGLASAPWQEWNADTIARTPRTTVPGLVEVGRHGDDGLPVLIATLSAGSNHFIGRPLLLVTEKPRSVNREPLDKQMVAKKHEADRVIEENNWRREQLGLEHHAAATIARNLMVRTVASMAPGAVDLTIYNSHGLPRGQQHTYPDLQPLQEQGLLHELHGGGLPKLIAELSKEVDVRGTQLQGGNLRHVAEAGERLPFRWRMVTLLGNGESLSQDQYSQLSRILEYGPTFGISVTMHGIRMPKPHKRLFHIQPVDRGWTAAANGGLFFRADPAAPPEAAAIAVRLAHGPAAQPQPGQQNGDTRSVAAQYHEIVREHTHTVGETNAGMRNLEERLPLLSSPALEALPNSSAAYHEQANRAAADPTVAAQAMRTAFGRHGGRAPAIDRLQAVALHQLVRALPETPGTRRSAILYSAAAMRLVSEMMPSLTQLVATTREHGRNRLPDFAEPYIVQYLTENPPTWAFQLVADAALHQPRAGEAPTAGTEQREAVAFHLAHAYGLEQPLIGRDGQFVNRNLAAALVQCELLTLYDFNTCSDELRNALVWQAQRAFDRVNPDNLPENALPAYAAGIKRLEEIGRQYNWRERAWRAAGNALMRRATRTEQDQEGHPAHGSPLNPRQ